MWPIRYRQQNSRTVISPNSSKLSNALDLIRAPSCIIARRRTARVPTITKIFACESRNILYGDLADFLIQDEAAAEFARRHQRRKT